MLLIVHKIWHGISPEGYRQVLTKINQNYICQQGNILLDNLRVLDLVRMSRSHVKGHRRGGVCVLRMLLVCLFCFFTPPRNHGGVIFSLQFVCVCVCVCLSVCLSVCVSGNTCEQNSSRTDAPIWMLTALAQTLLKIVTFDWRSRWQWRKIIFSS